MTKQEASELLQVSVNSGRNDIAKAYCAIAKDDVLDDNPKDWQLYEAFLTLGGRDEDIKEYKRRSEGVFDAPVSLEKDDVSNERIDLERTVESQSAEPSIVKGNAASDYSFASMPAPEPKGEVPVYKPVKPEPDFDKELDLEPFEVKDLYDADKYVYTEENRKKNTLKLYIVLAVAGVIVCLVGGLITTTLLKKEQEENTPHNPLPTDEGQVINFGAKQEEKAKARVDLSNKEHFEPEVDEEAQAEFQAKMDELMGENQKAMKRYYETGIEPGATLSNVEQIFLMLLGPEFTLNKEIPDVFSYVIILEDEYTYTGKEGEGPVDYIIPAKTGKKIEVYDVLYGDGVVVLLTDLVNNTWIEYDAETDQYYSNYDDSATFYNKDGKKMCTIPVWLD